MNLLESAICYAKKEPLECLAAALGIAGGFGYSSANPMFRLMSALLWCMGNMIWIIFARGEKKWALFTLQIVYLAQNVFAFGNVIFGWI
jgi:hypothetical protein